MFGVGGGLWENWEDGLWVRSNGEGNMDVDVSEEPLQVSGTGEPSSTENLLVIGVGCVGDGGEIGGVCLVGDLVGDRDDECFRGGSG